MLILCFVPIVGSGIVCFINMIKLHSGKAWSAGLPITVLFIFLYFLSWVIAASLALACEALFNITDEMIFLLIILGLGSVFSPWPAWGYNIRVKKLLEKQAKIISDKDKEKFI